MVDPLDIGKLGYRERKMWEMFSEYISLKISFNYTILNNFIARQSRLTIVLMTSSARARTRISLVDTNLVLTTAFLTWVLLASRLCITYMKPSSDMNPIRDSDSPKFGCLCCLVKIRVLK